MISARWSCSEDIFNAL
uniref:Uncharacterized protein n=1 Tax=Lepeophtheirus salmonis TaxID=72036 RepID=A0A0K2V8H7_LEPSM